MVSLSQHTPPPSTTRPSELPVCTRMPWHDLMDPPEYDGYDDPADRWHYPWRVTLAAYALSPDPATWPARYRRGDWPAPRCIELRLRRIYWLSHRDGGLRCRYCRASLCICAVTVDHLTPTSRGGTYAPANLGLACLSCNARKGTRTEAEFLAVA